MTKNTMEITARKISERYVKKEETELDALRKIDKSVKRPAYLFSYIFGTISAIIMGCGMSLIMTDISEIIGLGSASMPLGIVIGTVGLLLSLINYPIHKGILTSRKTKYAPRIIELSDKIIGNK